MLCISSRCYLVFSVQILKQNDEKTSRFIIVLSLISINFLWKTFAYSSISTFFFTYPLHNQQISCHFRRPPPPPCHQFTFDSSVQSRRHDSEQLFVNPFNTTSSNHQNPLEPDAANKTFDLPTTTCTTQTIQIVARTVSPLWRTTDHRSQTEDRTYHCLRLIAVVPKRWSRCDFFSWTK